jgi:uncharacterized protein
MIWEQKLLANRLSYSRLPTWTIAMNNHFITAYDRRELLKRTSLQLAATIPLMQLSAQQLQAASTASKKILFFTRSQTFEHSVVKTDGNAPSHAARSLMEFAKAAGFEFVETKDGGVFDSSLDQYDAIAMFTTGNLLEEKSVDKTPPMTAKGKQNLLDAVAAGKGFIGFHCASDTFHSQGPAFENQTVRDPYIDMIGGEFIRHGRQQDAVMRVVDSKFPGLSKAGEKYKLFEEWYSLKNFAKDMHVILVQETAGMVDKDYERPPYPATWARKQEKGRVFYTSMGHREDVWTNPIFQSIVVGGLQWITGQVEADITPNIESVTPDAFKLPVL